MELANKADNVYCRRIKCIRELQMKSNFCVVDNGNPQIESSNIS